jgi:Leu/Phe-tRNA-protein transferase
VGVIAEFSSQNLEALWGLSNAMQARRLVASFTEGAFPMSHSLPTRRLGALTVPAVGLGCMGMSYV